MPTVEVETKTEDLATPKMGSECAGEMTRENSLRLTQNGDHIDLSEVQSRHPSLYASIEGLDASRKGTLSIQDLAKAQQKFELQAHIVKWLKYIILIQLAVIVLQTGANFGVALWANQISKETGAAEIDGSSYLTSKSNSKAIMKTQLANSQIALHHAPVLTMVHLETIDRLSYNAPDGIERSAKVLGIEKSPNTTVTSHDGKIGELPAPEVTFFLATGAKIIVNAWGATLQDNNGVFELCGCVSCSSFEVDDPSFHPEHLDQMIAKIEEMHPDHSRRLSQTKKRCPNGPCKQPPPTTTTTTTAAPRPRPRPSTSRQPEVPQDPGIPLLEEP